LNENISLLLSLTRGKEKGAAVEEDWITCRPLHRRRVYSGRKPFLGRTLSTQGNNFCFMYERKGIFIDFFIHSLERRIDG